jgi:hypothetical protein
MIRMGAGDAGEQYGGNQQSAFHRLLLVQTRRGLSRASKMAYGTRTDAQRPGWPTITRI